MLVVDLGLSVAIICLQEKKATAIKKKRTCYRFLVRLKFAEETDAFIFCQLYTYSEKTYAVLKTSPRGIREVQQALLVVRVTFSR